MQPQLCSRCKKNVAVVFITRMENGKNINEGLCLKCAKNLGLPQETIRQRLHPGFHRVAGHLGAGR